MPPVGMTVPRQRLSSDDVAKAQADVLSIRYGRLRSPAKEQARDTGLSERACRNHQAGQNCMSLTEFFNSCQVIPEIQAWGAMMIGLPVSSDPEFYAAQSAPLIEAIVAEIEKRRR